MTLLILQPFVSSGLQIRREITGKKETVPKRFRVLLPRLSEDRTVAEMPHHVKRAPSGTGLLGATLDTLAMKNCENKRMVDAKNDWV